MLSRLDSVIELDPDTVVILVGTNDISYGIENTAEDNMKAICKSLTDKIEGVDVIIVPVLPSVAGNRSLEKIEKLTEIISYYVLNRDIYILIYMQFLSKDGCPDKKLFSQDGIHLSGEGYEIIVKELDLIFKRMRIN